MTYILKGDKNAGMSCQFVDIDTCAKVLSCSIYSQCMYVCRTIPEGVCVHMGVLLSHKSQLHILRPARQGFSIINADSWICRCNLCSWGWQL